MSIFDLLKKSVSLPIPIKDCKSCQFYRPYERHYGFCHYDEKPLLSNVAPICDKYTAFGQVLSTQTTQAFDPLLLQRGLGTTDGSGNASISFSTAFNSDLILVFLQGLDASARSIVLDVVSRNKNGFVVKARKVTGLNSSTHTGHSHSFTPSGTISSDGTHSHTAIILGDAVSAPTSGYRRNITSGDSSITKTVLSAVNSETGASMPTSSDGSHSHTFTGSGGTTGSDGTHSHTVDASALAVSFFWLAIAP